MLPSTTASICDPAVSCNGNGECTDTGGCLCFQDFYGADCGVQCTSDSTCGGNGQCNSQGICDCSPNFAYDGSTCVAAIAPVALPKVALEHSGGRLDLAWNHTNDAVVMWQDSHMGRVLLYEVNVSLCQLFCSDSSDDSCQCREECNSTLLAVDWDGDFCNSQGCEMQFENLPIGTRGYFAVSATNVFGRSAAIVAYEDVMAEPDAPTYTIAEHEFDVSSELSSRDQQLVLWEWGNPADYGDGRPHCAPYRVDIGFILEVTLNGNIAQLFLPEINRVELIAGIAEDGTFYVDVPKSNAPLADVLRLSGGQKGGFITFAVYSTNKYFESKRTSTELRVLGAPEPPNRLFAREVVRGVYLTWRRPLDTGYGDASANVSYVVASSLCESLRQVDEQGQSCRTSRFVVAVSQSDTIASFTIPEASLLRANTYYFVSVSSENARGVSEGTVVQVAYRIIPTLIFPQAPIFVALSQGKSTVWLDDGTPNPAVVVRAQSLFASSNATELAFATVYIPDMDGVAVSGNITQVAVDGINSQMHFVPPWDVSDICGVRCTALVVIESGGLLSKSVSFSLEFFTYELPQITSVFPQVGSIFGGEAIKVDVLEYTGARTRAAAGLPNLVGMLSGQTDFLTVLFACSLNGTIVSTVEAEADIFESSNTPTDDQVGLEIQIQSPPNTCSNSSEALIQIFDRNKQIQFDGGERLRFVYLGARLESVTPASAVIVPGSGGVDLRFFLRDFGQVENGTLQVSLGGEQCTVKSVDSLGDGVIVVSVHAPELPKSLSGSSVSLVVTDGGDREVSANWFFSAPPDAVIFDSTMTINGGFDRTLTYLSENIVRFDTNLLVKWGYEFDSLDVVFGTEVAVATHQTLGDIVRITATITPQNIGFSDLVITASLGGQEVATLVETSLGNTLVFEIRDPSSPQVISFAPSEVSGRSGSQVLVTIEQVSALLQSSSLASIKVVYDIGETVEVDPNGVISLMEWNEEGSAYQATVENSGFSTLLQSSSILVQSQYGRVISDAEEAVAEDESGQTGVILITLPAAPQGASVATLQVLNDGNLVVEFHITIASVPAGGAGVGRAVVSGTTMAQSGLGGGVTLEVLLTEFPLVRSIGSIVVRFGEEVVEIAKFFRSTSAGTLFSVIVPPSENPGSVQVRVYPAFNPLNNASFVFTYIDDRSPEIFDISPREIYADGGTEVFVDLIRFASVTDLATVTISVETASGRSVTAPSRIEHGDETSTVVFTAPAGDAGTAIISVQGGNLRAASSTFLFRAIPTSVPVVSLSPSVGPMSPDNTFLVTAIVLEMRQTPSKSDIGISFGGTDVDLTVDTDSRLVSTLDQTIIVFSLPSGSQTGSVLVKVWSKIQSDLVGSTTFRFFDSRQPGVEYYLPQEAFAGEEVNVTLGLVYFDTSNGVLAYAAGSGVTAVFREYLVDRDDQDKGTAVVTIRSLQDVVGPQEMFLLPCSARSDPLCDRNVSFTLQLLDPEEIHFLDVFPVQGRTYGSTPVYARFQNTGLDINPSDIMLDLGFENVTAQSVSFDTSGAGTRSQAAVLFRMPAVTDPLVIVPTVHFVGLASVKFSQPFAFVASSQPEIGRDDVQPAQASTTASNVITVKIASFPGVEDVDFVAAQFELEEARGDDVSTRIVSAETLSVTYLGVGLEPYQTQDLSVAIRSPTGAEVFESIAVLRIFHIEYPGRSAVFSGFAFIDTTLPRVSEVVSSDGGANSAKMSEATRITLGIVNAPSAVIKDDYQVVLGENTISISYSEVDLESRTARVVFNAPSSASSGAVHGLVLYGESADAECTPECCQTLVCSTQCTSVRSSCFTLVYYDDKMPAIEFLGSSSGPEIGGTVIEMRISLFPVLEEESDVLVTFGSPENMANVLVDTSDDEETSLSVISPQYSLDGIPSKIVIVTVTPVQRTEKAVSFSFRYEAAPVQLQSVFPEQGSESGGQAVIVTIRYFNDPSEVLVTFGTIVLPSSAVQVLPGSDLARSIITFTTPSTPVGIYRVTIAPRSGGESVVFNFLQFDATGMRITSYPSSGAFQSQDPLRVRLTGFPVFLNESAVSVTLSQGDITGTGQAVSVEQDDDGGTLMQILLSVDSFALGDITIEIDAGAFVSAVSFTYRLYDGTAERLLSVTPATVPAKRRVGGRTLNYKSTVTFLLANFPQNVEAARLEIFAAGQGVRVLDVSHVSTCQQGRVDCNITQLTVELPVMESLGAQAFTAYRDGVAVSVSMGSVEVVAGCDYDMYCGSSAFPDFKRILRSPAVTCSQSMCVLRQLVPDAEVVARGKTFGKTTGGDRIHVESAFLPVLTVSDIFVEFAINGKTFPASVEKYQEAVGGTLLSSRGSFDVISPPVGSSIGFAAVRVSVVFGSLVRSAQFSFEYLPVVLGPAEVRTVIQPVVHSSTSFQLTVELTNFDRLERPFNASLMRVAFNGAKAVIPDSIVSSSVQNTWFRVSGSPPAEGWPIGQVPVLVYLPTLGIRRAGMFNLTVQPTPSAQAGSPFPSSAASNQQHSIAVTLSYWEPTLTASDLTAVMATGNGNTDLTVVSLTQQSRTCQFRDCSKFNLILQTPSTNPDGADVGSVTSITVSSESQDVTFAFTFIATGSPEIVSFTPKSEFVVANATDQPLITILLRNFPSATCKNNGTCAQEASAMRVTFDVPGTAGATRNGVLQTVQDRSGLLSVTLYAPLTVQAGSVKAAIVSGEHSITFDYSYNIAPAIVEPIDGTSAGGTNVHIRAYALTAAKVQNADELVVKFGQVETPVLELQTVNDDEWVAIIRTPASSVVGNVAGTISYMSDPASTTTFKFEYYRQPTMTISPTSATQDGRTDSSGSKLATLVIHNFPPVSENSDVLVKFGEMVAAVSETRNFVEVSETGETQKVTILVVTVPAQTKDFKASVSVTYTGQENPPAGASLDATYRREEKKATAVITYYTPNPIITLSRWCPQCAPSGDQPCIKAGRCPLNKLPAQGGAGLSKQGVLTVTMENAPDLSLSGMSILSSENNDMYVQIGQFYASNIVVRSFDTITKRMIFEITPPEFTSAIDTAMAVTTVKGSRTRVTEFPFSVFDDRISLKCTSDNCMAPSSNGMPFSASITNLPVDESVSGGDLAVSFGSLTASSVVVTSANSSLVVMTITPPACEDCDFTDGRFAVTFRVAIRTGVDAGVGASTSFMFVAPPEITSARFHPSGSSILVTFNQATDRAGMLDQNCLTVIDVTSLPLLGSSPTCSWTSDTELRIVLQGVPTITVGSQLQVRTVRSKNLVSPASTSTASVGLPSQPVAPVVTMRAPPELDACSVLEVWAVASSPRALEYSWRGLDEAGTYDDADETFDRALQLFSGPTLRLPKFTPEMVDTDKVYTVIVVVRDFMGLETRAATSILKKSTASPNIVFDPPTMNIFRPESVLIRASVTFSACPVAQDEMNFEWAQISAPKDAPIPAASLNSQISQFSINPWALRASSTYRIQVTVTSASDITMSSSATYDIVVGALPLSARLVGGTEIEVSTLSNLTLDASNSLDPDMETGPYGLSFSWACSAFDGTQTDSCKDANGDVLVIPDVEQPTILAGVLSPTLEHPYVFTVTVSKPGKSPSTASIPVFVRLELIPQVSIFSTSGFHQSDGSRMINSEDKLGLVASCDMVPTSLEWSFEPFVFLRGSEFSGQGTSQLVMTEEVNNENNGEGNGNNGDGNGNTGNGNQRLTPGVSYLVTHTCTVNEFVGKSQMYVQVNIPPYTSDSCSICLWETDSDCVESLEAPNAIISEFRILCSGWSDPDGDQADLVYEYGYEMVQGNPDIVWSGKRSDPFYDSGYPSGFVKLYVRVTDGYGASTEQFVGEVAVEQSADRRRLLALSAVWQQFVDLLQEPIKLQDPVGVNLKVLQISDEVNTKLGLGTISVNEANEVSEELMVALRTAVFGFSVLGVDYVCNTLQAVQAAAANHLIQSPYTATNSTDMLEYLVTGGSKYGLDTACAARPVAIVSHGLTTMHNYPHYDGSRFISGMDTGLTASMGRFAISLFEDEESFFSTDVSEHVVRKRALQELVGLACVVGVPSEVENITKVSNSSIFLPATLAEQLSIDSSHIATLHGQSHAYIPTVTGMTARSLLFGATLYDSNDVEIDVSGLTENLNVLIPTANTNFSTNDQLKRFHAQTKCMWWDSESGSFSSAGCSTTDLNLDFVECSCNHLTQFAAIQQETGRCGDGVVEPEFEECDDGNVNNADGCSQECSVEKYFVCSSSPSVCNQTVFPEFTSAAFYQETGLQGSSNEISAHLYFNHQFKNGSRISLEGFMGTGTEDSEAIDLVFTDSAMSAYLAPTATWEQDTGRLTVRVVKEVSEYLSFAFVITNPAQDSAAVNVTVRCAGCLEVEGYSKISVESLTVKTDLLNIQFTEPACPNPSNFGSDCSLTCFGTVIGSSCRCSPGFFGFDCKTQGTMLGSKQVIASSDTESTMALDTGEGIVVPAGAIAAGQSLAVSIKMYESQPTTLAAQSALTPLGGIAVFGPAGTVFESPVSITLSFSAALLGKWQAAEVHWLDETTGLWESVGGSATGELMTAQVTHFTKFSVLGVDVPRTTSTTTTAAPTTSSSTPAPTTVTSTPPPTPEPSPTPPYNGGGGQSGGGKTVPAGVTTTAAEDRVIPTPIPEVEGGRNFNVGAVVAISVVCGLLLCAACVFLARKLTAMQTVQRQQQQQVQQQQTILSPSVKEIKPSVEGGPKGYVESRLVFADSPAAAASREPSAFVPLPAPQMPMLQPQPVYSPYIGGVFGMPPAQNPMPPSLQPSLQSSVQSRGDAVIVARSRADSGTSIVNLNADMSSMGGEAFTASQPTIVYSQESTPQPQIFGAMPPMQPPMQLLSPPGQGYTAPMTTPAGMLMPTPPPMQTPSFLYNPQNPQAFFLPSPPPSSMPPQARPADMSVPPQLPPGGSLPPLVPPGASLPPMPSSNFSPAPASIQGGIHPWSMGI